MESIPVLSIVLFLPTVAAIIIALFVKQARAVRITAALFTFAAFALSLALFVVFDRAGGIQFTEQVDWISSIGAQYRILTELPEAPPGACRNRDFIQFGIRSSAFTLAFRLAFRLRFVGPRPGVRHRRQVKTN